MKKILFFLVTMAFFAISACEYEIVKVEPVVIDPTVTLTYTTDIAPILTTYSCKTCHSGSVAPNLAVSPYSVLIAGYVDKTTPANSKLYTQLSKAGHLNATAAEKAKILLWITQGAKE